MKKLLRLFGVLCAFVLIMGCGASMDIHTSQLEDVNNGKYDKKISTFKQGETPVVVVSEVVDKEVTVIVYDLGTGKEVGKGTDTVPKGQVKWWIFPELPNGEYQAVLLIGGANKGATKFKVDRPTE